MASLLSQKDVPRDIEKLSSFFFSTLVSFHENWFSKDSRTQRMPYSYEEKQLNSEIISRDIILIVWEPRKKIILAIFPVTAKRKKPQKNQIKSCVTTHLN